MARAGYGPLREPRQAVLGPQDLQGHSSLLCLEDTLQRIQERPWLLTDTASDDFRLCRESESLANGLCDQICEFIEENPGTLLVIIDTLQMVRTSSSDSMYASDYGDISRLKKLADDMGVALLVIHHTCKMGDADVFKTISSSTDITGSADTSMVLTKESRSDKSAALAITGRDVETQELDLVMMSCHWVCVDSRGQDEIEAARAPEEIRAVISFIAERSEPWRGLTSELIEEAGLGDIAPAALGKRLNQFHGFLDASGIVCSKRKTNQGSELTLSRKADSDAVEGGGSDGTLYMPSLPPLGMEGEVGCETPSEGPAPASAW